jgi:hypothetical protein
MTSLNLMAKRRDKVFPARSGYSSGEQYIASGAIVINRRCSTPTYRQRIVLMMNMNKIVQHLWNYIKLVQTESLVPVFDVNKRCVTQAI